MNVKTTDGDYGIIPARAGFTCRRRGSGPGRPDHPRSRGVYVRCQLPLLFLSGSSPLARGLPADSSRGNHRDRIIPARAGFTRKARASSQSATDHPRSRGVYAPVVILENKDAGSSPLARGLHASGGRGLVLSGIIPARAGFTSRGKAPRFLRRDHPRSRGVYWPASPTNSGRRGSSPLARGLLALLLARLLVVRIIPARAGFTGSPAGGRRARRDHPCSRGVYQTTLGVCYLL